MVATSYWSTSAATPWRQITTLLSLGDMLDLSLSFKTTKAAFDSSSSYFRSCFSINGHKYQTSKSEEKPVPGRNSWKKKKYPHTHTGGKMLWVPKPNFMPAALLQNNKRNHSKIHIQTAMNIQSSVELINVLQPRQQHPVKSGPAHRRGEISEPSWQTNFAGWACERFKLFVGLHIWEGADSWGCHATHDLIPYSARSVSSCSPVCPYGFEH